MPGREVEVRATGDLHPDDTAAREWLCTELYRTRRRRGLTQSVVSARLVGTGNVCAILERQTSWKVATVQAWARALDCRLDLTIDGLAVPDDADYLAAVYTAQQPETVKVEDRLDLRILVNDLRRIRVASGVTQDVLAGRMGCTGSSLSRRESQPDPALLRTLQRHCRVLGGSLGVGLEDA
jgi:DNA-binding transcriptional regulator YiaG